MFRVVRRGLWLVLLVLICVVPVAGAQVDAGSAKPGRFVPPERVDKNPRLQSQLAVVASAARQRGAAAGLQTARAQGLATSQGKVRVMVEAPSSVARQAVAAQGGSVEDSAGALTKALVPAAAVAALSRTAGVDFVRAPFAFYPLGTESQGVAAAAASAWHAAGATGSGAKVAIIDMGFDGLAARQASGDLPAGLTKVDFCGGSMGAPEKHGTAVAEIVHEMAPSAQLTVICFEDELGLADALAYVKTQDITIVNHSVRWVNTSRGDGTGAAGTPDAIVADARANGVLWVNAAGNEAQQHWSGTFVNDGGLNAFAPSDVTNQIDLFSGEEVCGFLKWDAWPATNQDFDLLLGRDFDGSIVAASNGLQTGTQTPTEALCYTNTTGNTEVFSFLIDRVLGTTAPRLDLYVTVDDALEYQTAAGSVTEPATAPGALAVGAICWQGDGLEPFSSRGPTIDGRTKPDLVASSSVSSGIYGSFGTCSVSGFAGTSSAAPHVAGAAALLKAEFPLTSVSELQEWLESNALDLGVLGRDTSMGAGKLRLPASAPLASTTSAASATSETTASLDVAGSVTPMGVATTYSWKYGPTLTYGSQTALVTLTSPRPGQQVVGTLAGLAPDTDYHYRLIATNRFGTTEGEDRTQRTALPLPPSVVSQAPEEVGSDAARLAGSVTPRGSATTARFEWGTTAGYGTMTPPQAAGVLGSSGLVAELTGLAPNTEYHYRIVATNAHGTTLGQDVTFTTPAPAPPGGGGGGGGTADLGITGFAQPSAAPAVGADVTFQLRVTDVNVGLAFGVKVDVELPAGVQLVGSYADRGPGCSGAPLVCNLDFLSSAAPVAAITLQTRVVAPGDLTLKASVRHSAADPRPEDNAVTIVVRAATPPPTPATPGPSGGPAPTAKTGTAGANTLRGGVRADTLRGLGGNDSLYGLGGNDRLFGGSGNDRLFGGLGRDVLDGGPGRDVISARDEARDTIRCGPGRDTVTADRIDAVARDCERVTRR